MLTVGSTRKLQALQRLGHHPDTLTHTCDADVDQLYTQLSSTWGTCEETRQSAIEADWPLPAQWDDDDIDDPDAQPYWETCKRGHPRTRANTYVHLNRGRMDRRCRVCTRTGRQGKPKVKITRRPPERRQRTTTASARLREAIVTLAPQMPAKAIAQQLDVTVHVVNGHLRRSGVKAVNCRPVRQPDVCPRYHTYDGRTAAGFRTCSKCVEHRQSLKGRREDALYAAWLAHPAQTYAEVARDLPISQEYLRRIVLGR